MARHQDTALVRFYGLPKVHKDGAPLRPVVSLKDAPKYRLAKWLFRRLKFLTAESDTTVSSSAQFLEKLKGDLAIETIELLLRSKYDKTANRLGHAQILQQLKFCLRTYFMFDGTIYEQVKGTRMGSPISGFIAEAVLQRLESLVFQHHRPKFWARYMDDTFVVIERDQPLTFKEHLNAVFPDIQFTLEEEENNQLVFLDVLQDPAVETIELLLREKYGETENHLGRAQIIQLLTFCLKTYFTFDGPIYEQMKGTPVDSPISRFIVEAVLQRLKSLVSQHHRPKLWARYVDDNFVVIERGRHTLFLFYCSAIFLPYLKRIPD
ncbi:hypothetical protein SprV_0100309100 [Sparganum proliferum]